MAIERIETTILRNLLHNEEYYRKVVPFLKAEYYESYHEKVIYEEIADFAAKYDKIPTQEVLTINLQNRNDLTDDTYKDSVSTISSSQTSGSIMNGCSTPQKSGAKTELYTLPSCSRSRSQTEAIRRFREMRYPRFSKKPWRYRSTNT